MSFTNTTLRYDALQQGPDRLQVLNDGVLDVIEEM